MIQYRRLSNQAEMEARAMNDIKGLVPEIYYDMIARVAAGVPLVAILVSPTIAELEKMSNAASFILLIGLGYIAGHLLTTVSSAWNMIIWRTAIIKFVESAFSLKFKFTEGGPLSVFDVMYQRIDWATNESPNSGAILKKMDAGATLSDSLLSGWIFILIYQWCGGVIRWPWGLNYWHPGILLLVTAILILTVGMRRVTFIVRQDRILQQLSYPYEDPAISR